MSFKSHIRTAASAAAIIGFSMSLPGSANAADRDAQTAVSDAHAAALDANTSAREANTASEATSAGTAVSITDPLHAPATGPVAKDLAVKKLVDDALVLMRTNRNEQAAQKLKEAVALDPNSAPAHHNYGLALAKLGDTPHAIAHLQKALDLNPQSDASLLTLAGLQQSIAHVDEAIALYKRFVTEFSADPKLKPTIIKIQQLVIGLSGEKKEIDQVRHDTAKLEPVDGSGHSVLQVPAQTVVDDDYLAEATRKGILRWPAARMPIKVLIHPAENVGKAGDPGFQRGVPFYRRQWKDILIKSFGDWQKASEDLVRFQFVPIGSDFDLECYFVSEDRKETGGLQNDAEAGEAKMLMDTNGLAKGKIYVLTKSLSSVLPLTDNRMRVICLHEIGHALGLAGHTDNPDDIMFYSTSFKDEWRNLSPRDGRTIQRLYSSN